MVENGDLKWLHHKEALVKRPCLGSEALVEMRDRMIEQSVAVGSVAALFPRNHKGSDMVFDTCMALRKGWLKDCAEALSLNGLDIRVDDMALVD